MGIQVSFPLQTPTEKDLQLNLSDIYAYQVERRMSMLPAEWYPQSGVQLTWPHKDTDWKDMLEEVEACFINIAQAISTREKLIIVAPNPSEVKAKIEGRVNLEQVSFLSCNTNDTWARDHGAITMIKDSKNYLLDFRFNGWGDKFAAEKDNLITATAYQNGLLKGEYESHLDFVLEGGSIESDGQGTLLTTSNCLLSKNRNDLFNQVEIEDFLKRTFHLERILWLHHGELEGDDTDAHIDTLARFCNSHTIAYVKCYDDQDSHYEELNLMEEELKNLKTAEGKPYQLVPLPLPQPIYHDGERLPATYANFLILNDAVLVPTYQQKEDDSKVIALLQETFKEKEIIGIDCVPLIKQHGSLHCVTMQYPQNVID